MQITTTLLESLNILDHILLAITVFLDIWQNRSRFCNVRDWSDVETTCNDRRCGCRWREANLLFLTFVQRER